LKFRVHTQKWELQLTVDFVLSQTLMSLAEVSWVTRLGEFSPIGRLYTLGSF
jgi:hypothetical protein